VEDGIIDLEEYRKRSEEEEEEEGTFAVWGGDGERTRFALPLWRAIYILGGDRGAITWLPDPPGGKGPSPLFVLDLGRDPARLSFPVPQGGWEGEVPPPSLGDTGSGGAFVFLGFQAKKRWYLQVEGLRSPGPPEGKPRETLLFLAGECAGLLFYRDFAEETP